VTKLLVTAPSISPFAGSPFTMPVSARDAYDNFISTYNGTVHFTSSDPQAILPPDSALTNGIGTFTFTLKKALQQSVTATDVTNSSITGTAQFAVKPGPAVSFEITAPDSAVKGTPFNITVKAVDQYGNTSGQYSGTVTFTSSDPLAVLPPNSTLTNGQKTFSVTLNTLGNQ